MWERLSIGHRLNDNDRQKDYLKSVGVIITAYYVIAIEDNHICDDQESDENTTEDAGINDRWHSSIRRYAFRHINAIWP